MSRVVILHGQGPKKFKTETGLVEICTCGLSKKFPLCDDSHHMTEDEDQNKLYQYDESGQRTEVLEADEDDCHCGSHGCCDDEGESELEGCCGGQGHCYCLEDEGEVTELPTKIKLP